MHVFSDIPQGNVLGVALLNIFLMNGKMGARGGKFVKSYSAVLESRTSDYLDKLENVLKTDSACSACEKYNILYLSRNN